MVNMSNDAEISNVLAIYHTAYSNAKTSIWE
jgi:hypothetical protein